MVGGLGRGSGVMGKEKKRKKRPNFNKREQNSYAWLEVKSWDPGSNVDGGSKYLRQLNDKD